MFSSDVKVSTHLGVHRGTTVSATISDSDRWGGSTLKFQHKQTNQSGVFDIYQTPVESGSSGLEWKLEWNHSLRDGG